MSTTNIDVTKLSPTQQADLLKQLAAASGLKVTKAADACVSIRTYTPKRIKNGEPRVYGYVTGQDIRYVLVSQPVAKVLLRLEKQEGAGAVMSWLSKIVAGKLDTVGTVVKM